MTIARKRLILSAGALLGVGALLTAASFYDFANLNIGDGTDGGGIGAGSFNIQVVDTDTSGTPRPGYWQEADTVEGANIRLARADAITPGDTIKVDIPYRNASESLGADIRVWMNETPGQQSDPAYLDALRFSVLAADGTILQAPVGFEDFNELGEALQLDGGLLPAGAEGSLTLAVTLTDLGNDPAVTPNNSALNGGTAFVQLHFDAESVVA